MIIGHGLRDRQVRGPIAPGDRPQTRTLQVRRYVCLRCASVLVVVPRGLVVRRHFAAAAIAWAFALIGLLERSQADAWAAVSAWGASRSSWVTLRRWADAVRRRRLFPRVLGIPPGASLRRVAERVSTVIRASSPLSGALIDEVFSGAPFVAEASGGDAITHAMIFGTHHV